jgi:hypothetical protein
MIDVEKTEYPSRAEKGGINDPEANKALEFLRLQAKSGTTADVDEKKLLRED